MGIIIAVAYRWRKAPFAWASFAGAFRGLSWWWLGLALVFIMLSYLGRALRWRAMLRPVDHQASLWDIFSATIIGFTAIVLLGRAGELVRPYLIALKGKVPIASQMAAWVLERIFDLVMVLLIFGFALASASSRQQHLGVALQWVFRAGGYFLGFVCALCILLLVLFRNFSAQVRLRLSSALTFLPERHRARIDRTLDAFTQMLQSTTSGAFVPLLILYSAMVWVAIIACYACLFRAFPSTAELTLSQVIVFVGLVAFGSAVQIPGIGGGFQVAAVLVLTELFHLTLEPATGMAILIWIITFVVVVPFGILLSLREGFRWRRLSHLQEDLSL